MIDKWRQEFGLGRRFLHKGGKIRVIRRSRRRVFGGLGQRSRYDRKGEGESQAQMTFSITVANHFINPSNTETYWMLPGRNSAGSASIAGKSH
jgi:hypothetical protein